MNKSLQKMPRRQKALAQWVSGLAAIPVFTLGEGRRIWTVADSDYHFRTASGLYSSG